MELESVAVTQAIYRADREVRPHTHCLSHFGLVVQGDCSHGIARTKNKECIPGELHYLPAGQDHAFKFHSDTNCLLLRVKPPLVKRLREYTRAEPRGGVLRGETFHTIAHRLMREFQLNDEVSSLAIECLVMEALTELHRSRDWEARAPSPAVVRARQAINDHIGSPVRLSAIAIEIGMHPAHLAREFRRAFKCTMGDYLRQVRIQKALQLLPSSDASLSEIAQSCGFCDQSHFSRSFKRLVGMCPLAFRRQARK